jgi:uncharacterized DUF497 family protein
MMGGRGEWTRQINTEGAGSIQEFEYDPAKSVLNKEKHGIDFEEAKALWKDENKTSVSSRYEKEPRELLIASYDGKVYAAVTTVRENRIRLISVRRARDYEVKVYERGRNDI